MRLSALLGLAAAVAAFCPSAQATEGVPAYRVTDLGAGTTGFDLNNRGQVAGELPMASGLSGGFVWSASGGLHLLGGEGFGTGAYALNDVGQVLLVTAFAGIDTDGTINEFMLKTVLRNPDGSSAQLPNLPGFHGGPHGMSINNAGQVVGEMMQHFGNQDTDFNVPFLWSSKTGMQQIPLIDTEDDGNDVHINQAGQVLWNESLFAPAMDPFFQHATPSVRDADGRIVDLGLPNVGVQGSAGFRYGSAINDAGQVAGFIAQPDDGMPYRAFLWSPTAGLRYLADPQHSTTTAALNNAGTVLGTLDGQLALWTAAGGWRPLDSLLSAADVKRYGLDGAVEEDINNAGQLLLNTTIGGQSHALLLSPVPEPASIALLLVGFGVVVRGRQRAGVRCA